MSINGVHAATAREPGLRHGTLTVAARTEERALTFAIAGLEIHAVPAGASETSPEPSREFCEVVLQEAGPNKIQVIKVVRDHVPMGLKECKDLIEAAPAIVIRDAPRAKAERLRDDLARVGAVALLR
ncbi:MAG: ribosomal protein L7/L12 [Deltaproteobacteria bacterium]|nr:ribosomal protein L7/L12 [Deltaproteobacteria bacterium]